MKTIFHLSLALLFALCLTSCFQGGVQIQLKKDGSGEIHRSTYVSPQMTAMAAMAEEQGGESQGFGTPSAEELQADAAEMGEGVRFVRVDEGKNAEGWDGYVAVYAFDDINQVKISSEGLSESFGGDAAADAIEQAKAKAAAEGTEAEEGMIGFAYADGVLTVNPEMGESPVDSLKEQAGLGEKGGEGEDPFGGMKPSQMMGMMGMMFQGMRMDLSLKIDGGISKTDATHVDGDTITIMNADVGTLLTDQTFLQFIDQAAEDPDSVDEDQAMELIKTVKGLKVEDKKEFTVTFQ